MNEVANNGDAHRYEIREDGWLAGIAAYRAGPERIVFTHTEVDPEFGGRGIGGKLVRASLDDVRAQGLAAESRCSFVDHFVQKNPQYADLFSA